MRERFFVHFRRIEISVVIAQKPQMQIPTSRYPKAVLKIKSVLIFRP